MNRFQGRSLTCSGSAVLAAAVMIVANPAQAGDVLFVSDSLTDANNIPSALSGGTAEVDHPTIAGAKFRASAGGPFDHDVTIIRNDYVRTGGVVFAAEGTNEALAGVRPGIALLDYCAVYWSASGPHEPDTLGGGFGADGGIHNDPAVIANIEGYVGNGGYVFVTGHDALADPADPLLESLVGGAGAIGGETIRVVPNFGPFGTVFGFNNTLANGERNIAGFIPGLGVPGGVNVLDGVQDLDYIAGFNGAEVTPVVFEPLAPGGAMWLERVPAVNGGAAAGGDHSKGRIAYVANGTFLFEDLPFNPGSFLSDGEDASWLADETYYAAARNFAYNGCKTSAAPPPDAPANLRARVKRTKVFLTWSASADAVNYNVHRKLDSEAVFQLVDSVTGTSLLDTFPDSAASVEYYVTAENANGVSDPSTTLTVMPTSRR